MAVQRRYSMPTQVVETPEMKERIQAIADREPNTSFAQVCRDLHRMAIGEREKMPRREVLALRDEA